MSTTTASTPDVAPGPVTSAPAPKRSRLPKFLQNPWGEPRFLPVVTWTYIVWALVPVVIAILFSFNAGKSRSVWQGFSMRWWWGDPNQSIFHDPQYTQALVHSLLLAGLDMLIATPLGVLLAVGLARWRGRGSGVSNSLMLVPLVTPEIVMAVSLLVVFTQLAIFPFNAIHLGTVAQVVGQVTFSLVVRRRDHPQPPGLDRARVRGGGARPGRHLVGRPAAGPAPPAHAGHPGQHAHRVRALH